MRGTRERRGGGRAGLIGLDERLFRLMGAVWCGEGEWDLMGRRRAMAAVAVVAGRADDGGGADRAAIGVGWCGEGKLAGASRMDEDGWTRMIDGETTQLEIEERERPVIDDYG
jgi:hypothetical protein